MPMPRPPLKSLGIGAFALFGLGLIAFFSQRPTERRGDGWEYRLTTEAFARHGTPDIRPSDKNAVLDLVPGGEDARALTVLQWVDNFKEAKNGEQFALHFWFYSLTVLPVHFALMPFGVDPFNAMPIANAFWFLAALGTCLFTPGTPPLRRIAFAVFACLNPAIWYLDFTGVEVFSWALVTIGFVAWDRDRLTSSALAFALAALQNPPILLLAGLPPLLALFRRSWRTVLTAGLATSIGLLPFAFCYAFYGKPSLITSGYSDPKCISIERSFGMLFDLNQGLFPYVPVLLLAAFIGAIRRIRMGDLKAWFVLAAALGMFVAVQIQVNWNSDCLGLMRYLQWQIPALAWLAAAGLAPKGRSFLAALAVLVQGAILYFDPPGPHSYIEHRRLPRWVMTEAPYLYSPELEIFTERQATSKPNRTSGTRGSPRLRRLSCRSRSAGPTAKSPK